MGASSDQPTTRLHPLGLGATPRPRLHPLSLPGPPLLPLWYQGRYQGQEMLAVVLGGVSGQQEYLSKVLLQTSSVKVKEYGRGTRNPLNITTTSLSLHLKGLPS